MSDGLLTGQDAFEAISLVQRLGNANARFDATRLNAAIRSRAGRLRIKAGMVARTIVPARFHVIASPRATRRAASGHQRLAHAPPAPARPRPSRSPLAREIGS